MEDGSLRVSNPRRLNEIHRNLEKRSAERDGQQRPTAEARITRAHDDGGPGREGPSFGGVEERFPTTAIVSRWGVEDVTERAAAELLCRFVISRGDVVATLCAACSGHVAATCIYATRTCPAVLYPP